MVLETIESRILLDATPFTVDVEALGHELTVQAQHDGPTATFQVLDTDTSDADLPPASPALLVTGTPLNTVINDLLAAHFDPATDPNPTGTFVFTKTTDPALVPQFTLIGTTLADGVDLQLENVTLTFTGLEFVGGNWTGQVGVEAEKGVLFAGLLDIAVTDRMNDADPFAVVGVIDLAAGTPATLNLDDLDVNAIGWPRFLDIEVVDLALNFDNFRIDDNLNALQLEVALKGLDTGNDTLNDLIQADNPLFGIGLEGSVSAVLAVTEIEDAVEAALALDPGAALSAALAAALKSDITGVAGRISGQLFADSFTGGFIVKTVTPEPDPVGGSQDPVLYLAIEAARGKDEKPGVDPTQYSRGFNFDVAFAISELGPLQFFFSGGNLRTPDPAKPKPPPSPPGTIVLEEFRGGVRFNTSIEALQTFEDPIDILDILDESGRFLIDAGAVSVVPDGSGALVTLTVPGHDLAIGNKLRIRGAGNPGYDGDFTVLAVNGDQFTYAVAAPPGPFVGSAQVIRLTITDPRDLRRDGLSSGVAPPDSIFDWRDQLDQAVLDQIATGSSWANLTGDAVIGGGATVSISPIPDNVLRYEADFMLDSTGKVLVIGSEVLLNGLLSLPTKLYADVGDLFGDGAGGSGRFLYLSDVPEVSNDLIDPLLTYRGGVTFAPLAGTGLLGVTVSENTAGGFWELGLQLPIDNPSTDYAVGDTAVIFGAQASAFDGRYEVIRVDDAANTITMRSATDPGAWIDGDSAALVANELALGGGFRIVLDGGVDLNIPAVTTLTFEGTTQIDFKVPGVGPNELLMDLAFDATLSETNVGDIGRASGAFHVTVDADIPVDSTHPVGGVEIWGAALLTTDFTFLQNVGLFAGATGLLRINSSVTGKPAELLRDVNDNLVTVDLPAQSFALRLDGSVDFRIDFNDDDTFAVSESAFVIDGTFVLDFSADQGFNVAVFREVNGQVQAATLRLGPAGNPFLEFDTFAFLAIRADGIAANLVLSAEAALPLEFASLDADFVFVVNTTAREVNFTIPGGGQDPNRPTGLTLTIPKVKPANPSEVLASLSLNDLVNGVAWSVDPAIPGAAYGVVFLRGKVELLSVLELDASGYVLLSEGVQSIEVNVSGDFLSLASVSGSAFFSSQGEFAVSVAGQVQLGPDGFNLSGGASLDVSYWDSDMEGSIGDGNKKLSVAGTLNAGGEIFYIDLPTAELAVLYDGTSGDITVKTGTVPVPGVGSKVVDLGWLGPVRVYYPTIEFKPYEFTVGNLALTPQTDPARLGQVDGNGQLTLNVGSIERRTLRNLQVGTIDEEVLIDRIGAGSATGDRIRITMFGVSQTFDNVQRILAADMADGNDFVQISNRVGTTVEVHLGAGADTLISDGTGTVLAYGDPGDDNLTGGRGNDELYGGSGVDVIRGGRGQDRVEGGDDDDQLVWAVGDGSDFTFDGQGGQDSLEMSGTDSADLFTIGAAGAGLLIGDGVSALVVDRVELVTLQGRRGADTFAVNDLTGAQVSQVTLELGADAVSDTVAIYGTAGVDQYEVSTQKVPGRVLLDNGTPEDPTDDSLQEADAVLFTRTGGVAVAVLDAGAGLAGDSITLATDGGADTVAVLGTLAGTVITLDAGAGEDTFNIGGASAATAGTLNAIGGAVNLIGGADADTLNVSDAGDSLAGETPGMLSATGITGLGMATGIAYQGMEALNVNLGGAANYLTVEGTPSGFTTVVNGGNGDDRFYIRSVPSALTVNGGSGADRFYVSSNAADGVDPFGTAAGTLANVTAQLSINTGGSSGSRDAIYLSSSGSAAALINGALYFSSLVGLSNPTAISFETTSGSDIHIGLGAGNDIFRVHSVDTGDHVFVHGGGGQDTLNVGNVSGLLEDIDGSVSFEGDGGSDRLNIYGDGSTDAGLLTATQVTGLGLASGTAVIYAASTASSTVEALHLHLGAGSDTVDADSTNPGVTATIHGGGGADSFAVGSTTGNLDRLDRISGALVLDGEDGSDTITLNNSGNTADATGTLLSDTVSGLGNSGPITLAAAESINVLIGTGDDTFYVPSLAAGLSVLLKMGVGEDTVYVGTTSSATAGSLAAILGSLRIDAGSGALDRLFIDDRATVAEQSWTVTNDPTFTLPLGRPWPLDLTSVARSGAETVTYFNTEAVVLNAGSGADTILLEATHREQDEIGGKSSSFTVNAGEGADTVALGLPVLGGSVMSGFAVDEGAPTVDSPKGIAVYINGQGGADTVAYDNSAGTVATTAAVLTRTFESIFPADPATNPASANPDQVLFYTGLFGNDPTGTTFESFVLSETGIAASAYVYTRGMEAVQLSLGGAGDTVQVQSGQYGSSLTVSGGAGEDSFRIENGADFQGHGIILNGGADDDLLFIDFSMASIVDAGDLVQTVLGVSAENAPVASELTEIPAGSYYIETQLSGPDWQFRLVNGSGTPVLVAAAAGGAATSGWQNIAGIGASLLFDTQRGLFIQFAGDEALYQAGSKGAGTAAQILMGAPSASLALTFNGGSGSPDGDTLRIAGDGDTAGGEYHPDALVPNAGVVTLQGNTIAFTGVEPLVVHGLPDFLVVTPDDPAALLIDSVDVAGLNLDVLALHVVTVDGVVSWTQPQQLGAFEPLGITKHFAGAMAISPDGATMVVGAQRYLDGQHYLDNDPMSSGVVFVYNWDAASASWVEVAKLYAPDADATTGYGNEFGYSVAIDAAKTIVIGAPGDSTNLPGFVPQPQHGAAYVYTPKDGGWSFQKKLLLPPGWQKFDRLGASVAVDGATVMVSATGNLGDVYFFERGGPMWDNVTVSQGFAITGVGYGSKVALLGDTAIVTQPGWNAAWVFLRDGDRWESNDPVNTLRIDITGQFLEPFTDTNKNGKWDLGEPWDDRNWDPIDMVPLPGNANGRYDSPAFGRSVAMTSIAGGIRIALGAPGWNEGGLDANYQTGRVYIFEGSARNWTLVQTLTAAENVTGDRFGESVALSGSYLAVGAPGVDHAGVVDSGAAYLFVKGASFVRASGPTGATDRLVAASPNGGGGDRGIADAFGQTVVMGGGQIVAGIPGFDETSGPAVLRADAGAVRTFRFEDRIVADVNVRFNIPHAWDSDVRVVLRAPDNSSIILLSGIGGSGDNFTNTTLDDEAAIAITSSAPPYGGTYRPQFTPLSFFDGKTVLGNWSLEVTDLDDSLLSDSGSLSSWSLTFTFDDGSSGFYAATTGLGAIPDPGTRTSTISIPQWSPATSSLLVPAVIETAKTGASVAIDGDIAAVGAPDYDNRGAVFIYQYLTTDIVVADLDVKLNIANPGTNTSLDLATNLQIFLVSPTGTEVQLFQTSPTPTIYSFTDTVLDDEAWPYTLDTNIERPYTGTFKPLGSLADFDGQDALGDWELHVKSRANPNRGDEWLFNGTLQDWSLTFTFQNGQVATYTSTDAFVQLPADLHARDQRSLLSVAPLLVEDGWYYQTTIQPNGIQSGDEFGFSVGLSDGVLVVGAPGDSGQFGNSLDAGAFYVFQRVGDDWSTQTATFSGSAGWRLGQAVDVFGDTLVVGAPGFDNGPTTDVGIAFAFSRDGLIWTQSGQFSSNGGASAGVGSAIAIDAGHVVIGGPGYDGTGAAVIYRRTLSGFELEQVLKANDGAAGDRFGEAVDISGARMVVGAPGVNGNAGAAYALALDGSTWSPTMVNVAGVAASRLTLGPTAAGNDLFGHAVAIDGQRIILGAYGRDHIFNSGTPSEETRIDSGEAYAFGLKNGVWTLETLADDPLFGPGAGAGDQVGYAVAISGDNAVLGAPQLVGRLDGSDDTDGNGYVWLRTVSPPSTVISVEAQNILIAGATANTIKGTVGLGHVETSQLRFFDIQDVTLRTGSGADTITLDADGLAAYGLVNFTVETGAGDDTLTLISTELIPPAAREQFLLGGNNGADDYDALIGFFTFDGGGGKDTIATSVDGSWTLQLTRLVAAGGGPVLLVSVENARLTGGTGPNFFGVQGWLGSVTLDGAGGSDSYELFVTAGKHITIDDTGGSGIDYLVVNGTPLADAIFLEVDQISVGNSTVSYGGIETLILAGGDGDDYFRVKGSSAESVELLGQNGEDAYSIADGATASAAQGAGASTQDGGAVTEALEALENTALLALSIRDKGANQSDVDMLLAPVGAVLVEINPLEFKYTLNGVDFLYFDRSIEALSGTPTNNAPDLTGAASQVANEGASTLFNLGSFVDPVPSGTWNVTVDWGDGTAATVFSNGLGAITPKSHTFAQDGDYIVLVSVQKNAVGSLINARAFHVVVSNVAPQLLNLALDSATINEGGLAVLNGEISDPGTQDSFLLEIDWGEPLGSPERIELSAAAILPANVSFNPATRLFSVTHQYLENNVPGVLDNYAISVSVADEKGAADADATAITINDLAPTAVIGGDSTVSEGGTAHFDASGSTSSPDAIVSYEWDLDNDGAFDDATGLTASRIFSQNGAYTAKLRVTDDDGTASVAMFGVTVNAKPPTAVLTGAPDLVEGATAHFDASASTSDADAIVSYEWDWSYNGSTFVPSGDTGATRSHTYADNGVFTVAVRVTDTDGGSAVATMIVTVADVAPTIVLNGAASVAEGSSYTLTLGAVTDPGSDTVSSYVVYWGDGSTTKHASAGNVTHVYADGVASRTITVDLVNEDGTHLVAGTLGVSVLNVAPTIVLSGASTVAEGSSFTLNIGNRVDPGADTVTAIAIDWGDGTTTAGALGNNAHTYADDGAYTLTVTLTDEDGAFEFTRLVDVLNVAPTIALAGAATVVAEGTAYTLTLGAVTDPGDDVVTDYIVHWGDGSSNSYRADGDVTHLYADGETPTTITVDLLDRDGAYPTAGSLNLTVSFLLDVDGNGQADALSDGIVIIRHLFGFTGNALVNGVVDPAGTRNTPPLVEDYLRRAGPVMLDVDGNGQADALSDGIVIVRYLFGFTGDALINGVVDPAGTRHTAAAVEAFLNGFLPIASPSVQETIIVVSEPAASSALTTAMTTTATTSDSTASSVPLVVMESATATATPVVATDTDVSTTDLSLAYVQRSWVQDYVADGVSLAEEDEELLIALPG